MDKLAAIQSAREYAAQGHIDRALAECRDILAHFPDEAQVHLCIGDLSLKSQRRTEAVESYSLAAKLFLREGGAVNALSCYKHILKIEPNRAEIFGHLGDIRAGRGQVNNAVGDYLAAAKLYAQGGMLEKALETYQKILALSCKNICVRLRVAELYTRQGLLEEGIEEYLRAADDYERSQKHVEARVVYDLILKHVPGHPEVCRRLSLADVNAKELDGHSSLEGAGMAAGSHSGNGGPLQDPAVQDPAMVVEPAPTIEIIIPNPTEIVEPIRVGEASFDDTGQSWSNEPLTHQLEEELETQYELALAYKEMGLLDEAIETFERAVHGPNRYLDSCAMIAMCYKDRHLNKAAISWLERALRNPQCEGTLALFVKHSLAQLYEVEGLSEKAAQLYATIPAMRQAGERLLSDDKSLAEEHARATKFEQPEKTRRISFF
jgi:tetratricopeptide (TPR) repeat protein